MTKKINCNFKGEKNGNSKLDQEMVEQIRSLYKEGSSQRKIADAFNICKTHARRIVLGISWR